MHTNGNQDIITLNRDKGLKKRKQTNKQKTMNSFFSWQSRFYLCSCLRIFPSGVAVEKYLFINSMSLHSDKSVPPETRTIA